MVTREDVHKYLRYALEAESFSPRRPGPAPSDQALRAVERIRNPHRGPALIVHGIMPRSGTVYVGELLRLHPSLYAYPNGVWEFPLLQRTGDILRLQRRFLLTYEQNIGKLGGTDFLPLFAASLMARIHQSVPPGERALLKVPSAQYLTYFWDAFPFEHLLLLVRDARDVVHSTLETWPQLRFSIVCRRWKKAAEMVLAVRETWSEREDGYWLARFEDAVTEPKAFVAKACRRFDLDPQEYPLEAIDAIPVRGSSSLASRRGVSWRPAPKPEGYSPLGHWREWPAWRKFLFKRIAGKALLDLGYCDDLDW